MCRDSGCSESPSAGHSPGRGKGRAETYVWEDIYCHWVDVYTLGNDHRLPEDYILSPAASHS